MTKKHVAIKSVSFIASFYRLRILKRNASLPNYQADQKFMAFYKTENVRLYVIMKECMENFYKERLKLKCRYWGEPAYIKAITDKIDSDIGMISFIISSIKEIELETDVILTD